jgi:hypothetical protein
MHGTLSLQLRAESPMESTESGYSKWRRKTFVLYRFQSYYALIVVAVSIFLTLMTSSVVYRVFHATGSVDSALEVLVSDRGTASLALAAFLLMICSFAAFYLTVIVATHRFAGPLSVMSKHLAELGEGRYPILRDLRTHDELKEFFALFRAAVDRMRAQQAREAETLREAIEGLSGSGTRSQQAVGALKALLDAKLRAVGQGALPLQAAEQVLQTGTGQL